MEGVYTFNPARRYRQVRVNSALSSPVIVFLLLITLVCMLAAGAVWIFGAGDEQVFFALLLLSGSVFAFFLLLFTFSVTSLPFQKPLHTVTELLQPNPLVANIAEAADYRLIQRIGPVVRECSAEEMQIMVRSLAADEYVSQLLYRLQIDTEHIIEAIYSHVLPHMSWSILAHTVVSQAAAQGHQHIDAIDVMGVFLLHPGLHAVMRHHGFREQDISFMLWWQHVRLEETHRDIRWWDTERLLAFSGIGLSWASGFTPFVDQFMRIPEGNLWDIPFGHTDQVDHLVSALARRKQSNVLLVGQPGVGRLGVVREMARRVYANKAHPSLSGQRIAYINIGELASFGGSSAEQLNVVARALNEMERAGNMIVVLDGLSSVLGQAGEQRINVSDVLLPFFSSPEVRVVAIASLEDFHSRLRANDELSRLFEIVQVPALSADQTLQLLAITIPSWEKSAKVAVPYATLREIVTNTEPILPQVPFPEKAFDVLEEVVVNAEGKGKVIITPEDINNLVSQKVGVNIGKVRSEEAERLLNLEEILHQRIVNQERAVSTVAKAMVRARAGVRNQKKPIGTFLFLGPTGVGKTEAAKALAEAYFGSEDVLQRLDMSGFQGQDGVSQLVGDASRHNGRLTSMVADHPYSVLLFDEFEKADMTVQQVFLPIFDEGFIYDSRGKKYVFNNTIMIATSNAGAEFIRTNMQEDGSLPPDFDNDLREHVLSNEIFRPEVLNRFDGVITFTSLTPDHIRQIAVLMMRKLNKRLDIEHGVTVALQDGLLDFLVREGYDAEFGARPMNRLIQNTVEYAVAEHILRGKAEPGQEIALPLERLNQLHQAS